MKEKGPKESFLIFGFLRKILSKEETEVFNEKIKMDDFKENVSEEVVRQYSRSQLKSKLDSIHDEVARERKRKKKLLLLLSFLILILTAIMLWIFVWNKESNARKSPQKMYVAYFDPYPNLFEQKGNPVTSKGFSKMMNAYSNQNYPEAIRLFEQQTQQKSAPNILLRFYYGVSLLANQQAKQAENIFLGIKKTPGPLLPETVLNWYLALSYLSLNNVSEARPLLLKIASQNQKGFKQAAAKSMLDQLEPSD